MFGKFSKIALHKSSIELLKCPTCGRETTGVLNDFSIHLQDAIHHETYDCITSNTEKLKKFENYGDIIDEMSLSKIVDNIDDIRIFAKLKIVSNTNIYGFNTISDILSMKPFENVNIGNQTYCSSDDINDEIKRYDGIAFYNAICIEDFLSRNEDILIGRYNGNWSIIKTRDFIIHLSEDSDVLDLVFNIHDKKKADRFAAEAKLKYGI